MHGQGPDGRRVRGPGDVNADGGVPVDGEAPADGGAPAGVEQAPDGEALPAGEAPAPRMLLVSGAGGAGRTTVAAAGAVAAARSGRRTLLLSGEASATLEAVLGMPEGSLAAAGVPGGTETGEAAGAVVPGTDGFLRAARTDSGEHFRHAAVALQERGRKVLDLLGSQPLDEDELTELPGADALTLLSALRAVHAAGEWDTLVVDLPPAPVALRTLALPAQLRRYLRRLLPAERQAARALRPALAQLAGVPMPADALYATAARWDAELADVQGLLASSGTTVRLVAEPGPSAARALRLGRAGLGLYGLPLEAVVANRVVPSGSPDAWTASLSAQQQTVLKTWREECGPDGVPVCELPHLGREPRGAGDLLRLAPETAGTGATPDAEVSSAEASSAGPASHRAAPQETHGGKAPGRETYGADGAVEDRLARDGLLVWRLALPAVRKEELDLVRRGDELILGVGPYRRVFPLPSALRRCRVVGASLDGGELRVRCAPDPALWPEGGDR